MLERFITELRTDDPGVETSAATRERLKGRFAPGSTRRMTLLGMLVGAALGDLPFAGDDTVVYASAFGEGRALEDFLASFPLASPTLFQTSIHPSGVQQGMIGRQRSVRELFPHAGSQQLALQALLTAMLAPGEAAVLAGGEERGTWLVEPGAVSDRSFAYAVRLAREAGPGALGRLVLTNETDCHDAGCLEFTGGNMGGTPMPRGGEDTGGTPVCHESEYTGKMPVPQMRAALTGETSVGGAPALVPHDARGDRAEQMNLSHVAWFDLLHHRRPFDGLAAEGWRLQLTWS